MGFKEQLFKDILNTFMNPDEFGEKHIIDGKEVTCIIDNMEIIERNKKVTETTDGVFQRELLIYVARADIGKLPAIGRSLIFDGRTYRVKDSIDEGAVYSVTLGVITS